MGLCTGRMTRRSWLRRWSRRMTHPEQLAAMAPACRRLYEQQYSNAAFVENLTRLVQELTE